jgi:transposase
MGISTKGRKRIPKSKKYAISVMHKSGHTAKKNSEMVDVPLPSVYRVLQLFNSTGSTDQVSAKQGRKKKQLKRWMMQ